MNEYGDEKKPSCYIHSKEQFVGVCPLCLNEKLLVLFAQQELAEQEEKRQQLSSSRRSRCRRRGKKDGVVLVDPKRRKRYIRFTKLFALGSLIIQCWKSHDGDVEDPQVPDICTSLEDSFISIKFEGNEVASWDKDRLSRLPPDQKPKDIQTNNKPKELVSLDKSVDVHNPRPRASLKWRKRMINQLLKLMRLRRSKKKTTNVKSHEVKKKRWRRSCFKRRRRTIKK